MIEGSGSIPPTNGSGSGSRRPKNTWIRIRNSGWNHRKQMSWKGLVIVDLLFLHVFILCLLSCLFRIIAYFGHIRDIVELFEHYWIIASDIYYGIWIWFKIEKWVIEFGTLNWKARYKTYKLFFRSMQKFPLNLSSSSQRFIPFYKLHLWSRKKVKLLFPMHSSKFTELCMYVWVWIFFLLHKCNVFNVCSWFKTS